MQDGMYHNEDPIYWMERKCIFCGGTIYNSAEYEKNAGEVACIECRNPDIWIKKEVIAHIMRFN